MGKKLNYDVDELNKEIEEYVNGENHEQVKKFVRHLSDKFGASETTIYRRLYDHPTYKKYLYKKHELEKDVEKFYKDKNMSKDRFIRLMIKKHNVSKTMVLKRCINYENVSSKSKYKGETLDEIKKIIDMYYNYELPHVKSLRELFNLISIRTGIGFHSASHLFYTRFRKEISISEESLKTLINLMRDYVDRKLNITTKDLFFNHVMALLKKSRRDISLIINTKVKEAEPELYERFNKRYLNTSDTWTDKEIEVISKYLYDKNNKDKKIIDISREIYKDLAGVRTIGSIRRKVAQLKNVIYS